MTEVFCFWHFQISIVASPFFDYFNFSKKNSLSAKGHIQFHYASFPMEISKNHKVQKINKGQKMMGKCIRQTKVQESRKVKI
jgi:hypothetical protein